MLYIIRCRLELLRAITVMRFEPSQWRNKQPPGIAHHFQPEVLEEVLTITCHGVAEGRAVALEEKGDRENQQEKLGETYGGKDGMDSMNLSSNP